MNRRVRIAILVMGFSGLVAEILLLRELLIVFSGNELSIGVILANWLILEALGCFFPDMQTLSKAPEETDEMEPLRAGSGRGAFVVVRAKRP